MNVLVGNHRLESLPGFLLLATSPDGNDQIYKMRCPLLLKDKRNMLDSLEILKKRLEREIEVDMEAV